MNTEKLIAQTLEHLPPGWSDISETTEDHPVVGFEIPNSACTFLAVKIKMPWLVHDFYADLTPEQQANFQTTYELYFINDHEDVTIEYYSSPDLSVISAMVKVIPLDFLAESPSSLQAVSLSGSPLIFWNGVLVTGDAPVRKPSESIHQTGNHGE